MADKNVIEYELSVDGTQASASLKKAADDVRGFATETKGGEKAQEGFSRQAQIVSQRLAATGQSLQSAGSKIQSASAGWAKIGVAAIASIAPMAKAAAEYDREFSKITGLVGIAAEEVEKMKESTLALSGETARAPQELAAAMFTIQSAGLRGATGAQALEQAAKLAAGGMGETRDIAQAMTSILDQYASKNVDAAEAADFLAATARAGNFESSQLAGGLGKVLPIAAQLDIGLTDVGGAIALLTRGNGNASESITQVAAAMRVLMAPSQQASDILGDAGLTMQDVKDTAAGPGGLVAALQQMYDATGNNDEAFAKMLGSSEAVSAAFQILNASNEALEGTFGAVADSAGVAAEVFNAAAATDSFKFEQAITELKVAGIQFATEAAPLMASGAATISGAVGRAAEAFAGLPPGVQATITQIAGIAAVAGPAVYGLGRLVSAAGNTAASLSGVVSKIGSLNPMFLGVGAAVGIGVAAFTAFKAEAKAAEARAETYAEALRTAQGINDGMSSSVEALNGQLVNQKAALQGSLVELEKLTPEAQAFIATMNSLGQGDAVGALALFGASIEDVSAALSGGATAEQLDRVTAAFSLMAESGAFDDDELFEFAKALAQTGTAASDAAEKANALGQTYLDAGLNAGMFSTAVAKQAIDTAKATGALNYLELAADDLRYKYEVLPAEIDGASLAITGAEAAFLGMGEAAVVSGESLSETASEVYVAEGAVMDLAEALGLQASGWDEATQAANGYQSMLDGLTSTQKDLDSATFKTIDAFESLNDAAKPTVFNEADSTYRSYITTSRAAASAVKDQTFALIANGATLEDVQDFQAGYTEQLAETLKQAGLTDAAIDELISTYLTVPDEIITEAMAEVAAAEENVDRLMELFRDYGASNPTALLQADAANVNRILARTLLELGGYDATAVDAALRGDPAELEKTLDAVWANLDEIERAQVITTVQARFDAGSGGTVEASLQRVASPRRALITATASTYAATSQLGFAATGRQAYIDAVFGRDLASFQIAQIAKNYTAYVDIVTSGTPSLNVPGVGYSGASSPAQSYAPAPARSFGDPSAIAAYRGNSALYMHEGGVVGAGAALHNGASLRTDERQAVLQTGERVLSRRDNEWFERTMMGSERIYPASMASGGDGGNVTVSPGAVMIDARGSGLSAGDVNNVVDRAIKGLTRDLTNSIRSRTR